jgi:hypothetical protein
MVVTKIDAFINHSKTDEDYKARIRSSYDQTK